MILIKPIFLFNFISGFMLYLLSLFNESNYLIKIIRLRFVNEENIDNVIPLLFFASNASNFFAYFTIKCWLRLGFSQQSIFVNTLVGISNISNFIEIIAFIYVIRRMYIKNNITFKFVIYTYLSSWFLVMYFLSITSPNTFFDIFFNPISLLSQKELFYNN